MHRRDFLQRFTPRQQPAPLAAFTPTAQFFRLSYSHYRPTWTLDNWRLHVSGMIQDAERVFRWADVQALPQVEQPFTLECINNPAGGALIGTARWGGVRLRDLLAQLRLKPGIRQARLSAWDGYQTSVPLESLLHPDTLLATHMNGEALPLEHGFPMRILIPGLYGQKMPKWLQRIEFIAYDFRGYWEQKGYSASGQRQPHAFFVEPPAGSLLRGQTRLAGFAHGGAAPLAAVELRIDGGMWLPARLLPNPHPHAWTGWLLDWEAPAAGSVLLEVRAINAAGELQAMDDLYSGRKAPHRWVLQR